MGPSAQKPRGGSWGCAWTHCRLDSTAGVSCTGAQSGQTVCATAVTRALPGIPRGAEPSGQVAAQPAAGWAPLLPHLPRPSIPGDHRGLGCALVLTDMWPHQAVTRVYSPRPTAGLGVPTSPHRAGPAVCTHTGRVLGVLTSLSTWTGAEPLAGSGVPSVTIREVFVARGCEGGTAGAPCPGQGTRPFPAPHRQALCWCWPCSHPRLG